MSHFTSDSLILFMGFFPSPLCWAVVDVSTPMPATNVCLYWYLTKDSLSGLTLPLQITGTIIDLPASAFSASFKESASRGPCPWVFIGKAVFSKII